MADVLQAPRRPGFPRRKPLHPLGFADGFFDPVNLAMREGFNHRLFPSDGGDAGTFLVMQQPNLRRLGMIGQPV